MPEGVLPGIAKREQRSFGARCPSAALSDVRLCGHVSGLAAWPYVSRSLLAAPEEGHDLSAVAGLVRCKEAVTNAAGDAVLCCPLDGFIVIGIVRHVIEEVENAVVLHKNTKEVCVQGEEYTILVSCFCPESRNGYYGEWMDLMVSYLRTY